MSHVVPAHSSSSSQWSMHATDEGYFFGPAYPLYMTEYIWLQAFGKDTAYHNSLSAYTVWDNNGNSLKWYGEQWRQSIQLL